MKILKNLYQLNNYLKKLIRLYLNQTLLKSENISMTQLTNYTNLKNNK